MITLEELSKKTKNEIRSNQKLSNAFSHFFSEIVGGKPSFCCSFSDYNKLFKTQKTETMAKENSKYNVSYPKDTVLAYRHNGKTVRQKVKNASDEFLENFLNYHAPFHYKDAKNRIVLKEHPEPKKETKKSEAPVKKEAPAKETPKKETKVKPKNEK